jgi:hypothetical protein
MTADEIIDLLTLITAYDQRTVGGDDVQAWLIIANAEDWTLPLARRAVIEHHRRGGDRPRIKPGHITDTLTELRREISRTVFHTPLVPPRELADDPRAEIAWRRDYARRTTDRALNAWARGEPLPALPPADPPVNMAAAVSAVDPAIRLLADRKAVPPIHRGQPADANDTATRLAAARAELDAIRHRHQPPADDQHENPHEGADHD